MGGKRWKNAHAVILIPICFDECVSVLILVETSLDVPFISVPSMKDRRLQVTFVRIDERSSRVADKLGPELMQNEDVYVDMGKEVDLHD